MDSVYDSSTRRQRRGGEELKEADGGHHKIMNIYNANLVSEWMAVHWNPHFVRRPEEDPQIPFLFSPTHSSSSAANHDDLMGFQGAAAVFGLFLFCIPFWGSFMFMRLKRRRKRKRRRRRNVLSVNQRWNWRRIHKKKTKKH